MAAALDGLIVLDLTTHLSGPFCGMQLADMGADVIKIESPQGDSIRGAPPFVEGEGAPFMLWNRNKRGIVLDLKAADDLEIFWDLVDGADVVLENFRPGVLDKLGVGWSALHMRNPRLILGSISGFGQTGPYAKRGGFDLVIQAMSGLMSVTGPKDGPPYRIPLAISDVGAGLYLTIGVLSALQARHKTEEIAKRSTADWMTALEAEGIPAGPVLHHDEVFADPQILARGMVAEVEHATAGKQKTLGVPIKMSATPGGVRRAAPTLGQHDGEIRASRRKATKERAAT